MALSLGRDARFPQQHEAPKRTRPSACYGGRAPAHFPSLPLTLSAPLAVSANIAPPSLITNAHRRRHDTTTTAITTTTILEAALLCYCPPIARQPAVFPRRFW